MTVDEFAAILRDCATVIEQSDYYFNDHGVQGYRANIVCRERWFWLSVSNSPHAIALTDIAQAITSCERIITREGSYNGGRGYEATVSSNGRFYMLGHGRNTDI